MTSDAGSRLSSDELDAFRLTLARRKEDEFGHQTFYYEPVLHYVYLPDADFPSRAVINYAHELAHGRLGHTVFATVVRTLFSVAVAVNGRLLSQFLFPIVAQALECLDGKLDIPSMVEERSRDDQIRGSIIAKILFAAQTDSLLRLVRQPEFLTLAHGLREVYRRRDALLAAWAVCQEGYATYFQVRAERDPDDPCSNMIAGFWPDLSNEERERTRAFVAKRTANLVRDLESGNNKIGPHYREGFALFHEIVNLHGNPAALDAALLASHLPYFACNVLDSRADEFDALVAGPLLSPDVRLRRLMQAPEILAKVQEGQPGVREVLAYLVEDTELSPLSDISIFFTCWEAEHIWGSDFARRMGIGPTSSAGAGPTLDLREVADVRGETMNSPPIVTSSGTVLTDSQDEEAALVRNFTEYGRLQDTLNVLDQMETLLQVKV